MKILKYLKKYKKWIIRTKRKKLKKMLTDNGKKSNQTLRRFDKHFGGFSFKKALNEGIGTIY